MTLNNNTTGTDTGTTSGGTGYYLTHQIEVTLSDKTIEDLSLILQAAINQFFMDDNIDTASISRRNSTDESI